MERTTKLRILGGLSIAGALLVVVVGIGAGFFLLSLWVGGSFLESVSTGATTRPSSVELANHRNNVAGLNRLLMAAAGSFAGGLIGVVVLGVTGVRLLVRAATPD